MKIRIKGNTVRYRLSRSEVAALHRDGHLQEQTDFPGVVLSYAIRRSAEETLSAGFERNTITLSVPAALLEKWALGNEVSIDHRLSLPGGHELYLLLEKDFKCIDADVKEDQSDYFENPHLHC